ncbi:hypothetical protein D9615_009893 [Tricholomella constricta]|uniref:Uncharacterized protein n=1 Tax=Tricholomella constricta TaxID=117010 RepID=A0A8H5LYF5_9AGAR|nr:hypothetical protein D9615_009893 [Tricholomella constricta]
MDSRLVIREPETIAALAEAAMLESRLGVAHAQIQTMDTELKALRDCKDAKRSLEVRVEGLLGKATGLEESFSRTTADLRAAQTTLLQLETGCAVYGLILHRRAKSGLEHTSVHPTNEGDPDPPCLRAGGYSKKVVPISLINVWTTVADLHLVIFAVSMWADTLEILRSEASFRRTFPSSSITSPRLLWDHNDDTFDEETRREQVSEGADNFEFSGRVGGELRTGLAAVQQQVSEGAEYTSGLVTEPNSDPQ